MVAGPLTRFASQGLLDVLHLRVVGLSEEVPRKDNCMPVAFATKTCS